MSRQSLPRLQSEIGGSHLFPSFQREMHRLLDQFRTGFPTPDPDNTEVFARSVFPAIDVTETDDTVEISAEVPGVKKEDLEASIADGVLTLKGEKSSDHEEKKESYHLIERSYGSFRRQIPLGFSPEEGAVDAKFSDGVLKLSIKKPASAKTGVQKIEFAKG